MKNYPAPRIMTMMLLLAFLSLGLTACGGGNRDVRKAEKEVKKVVEAAKDGDMGGISQVHPDLLWAMRLDPEAIANMPPMEILDQDGNIIEEVDADQINNTSKLATISMSEWTQYFDRTWEVRSVQVISDDQIRIIFPAFNDDMGPLVFILEKVKSDWKVMTVESRISPLDEAGNQAIEGQE